MQRIHLLLNAIWDLFEAIENKETDDMAAICENPEIQALPLEETFNAIDDLLNAIKENNIDAASAILETLRAQGLPTADILNHDYGRAGIPLHWAASQFNDRMVRLLVQNGANLKMMDKHFKNPLCVALHEINEKNEDIANKISVINKLWVPGTEPKDPSKWDAINALIRNILERINRPATNPTVSEMALLQKHSFHNALLDFMETISCLNKNHISKEVFNIESMKLSLENPITSINHPYTKQFLYTIDLRAIQKPTHPYHACPTLKAASLNNVEALKHLQRSGFSLDAQDEFGNAPLHYATSKRAHAAMCFLVQQGANPLHKNHGGKTAFDLCNSNPLNACNTEEETNAALTKALLLSSPDKKLQTLDKKLLTMPLAAVLRWSSSECLPDSGDEKPSSSKRKRKRTS